ncbi:hypothetical protein ACJOMT_02185 [Mycoplasmopsis synoviae]|nr:hypothetical protein [Mycoplasmopsis synoviae]UBX97462.1 hypothetical protein K6989_00225 [Mycoplasmopsis synoviae]UZF64809.1 hypothetical protein N0B75_02620 [Mycoplasmopsis synoviae]UZF65481.1 hypothetical protein N0B74_02625 [Mycoplasmopsis synoviae]
MKKDLVMTILRTKNILWVFSDLHYPDLNQDVNEYSMDLFNTASPLV